MQPPMTEGVLWAKFPDIRKAWGSSSWTKDEKATLRNRLQTPFTPNLRHEAGSALAAWDAWLQDEPGLTALAVFLAASHHGKVRTILRSRGDDDDTFGLSPGDVLRRIPERFEKEAILQFAAKRLGANGDWSDDGTRFLFSAPSWVQMVAELLGSFEPSESIPIEAVPTDEPRNLGPFVLAYLESLLCTADVRASQMPGKRSNQ